MVPNTIQRASKLITKFFGFTRTVIGYIEDFWQEHGSTHVSDGRKHPTVSDSITISHKSTLHLMNDKTDCSFSEKSVW